MDARLPDGSRVHVIIPPSSRGGPHISIRKFKKSKLDLDTLVDWGSLSAAAAEFLKIVVKIHQNTIISGGTGTGKTSMLNALSASIPEHERIIVIEDSSELQLHQPHTVYLEAQPAAPDGRGRVTIQDLFVDSLRMRPDRIVVGEVRRGEALDMIQSMLSGHARHMTTTHANTPIDAMIRLETMTLMSRDRHACARCSTTSRVGRPSGHPAASLRRWFPSNSLDRRNSRSQRARHVHGKNSCSSFVRPVAMKRGCCWARCKQPANPPRLPMRRMHLGFGDMIQLCEQVLPPPGKE